MKTVVVTITVDPADVGRLLGVHDTTIALIKQLAARAATLLGCRVQLVVPQKGKRR